MKPAERTRLTTALRDHVGKIAADLQLKMRAPGDTRVRAQQLHADEHVAEDFDVWTDLLSRRAAVLWVLKSVYVRVLEDRGLLSPGRLLDQEAQQLFERLAPHLGETAFLRWVYRDLASSHGGLPELFSPQPAEVALPSDELSRALIAFWRHRDADTGATWSFAEERFDGELMGDLYQELDPVVKDRFALCQTPDFVRAFILDRTLTPAIETFGAEEVRLLDPACGSGHFLIDGLKRLVEATAAKHSDWERGKVVAHALERVVGVDLNDYACALARARLIMTAAELAGVTSLADAARFHPHLYWADGLEQVERDEVNPALQYSFFEKVEEKPRATLTRSDVRAALRKVFATKFHAVVANPPYITEKDAARRDYHREKLNRKQRYLSAYKEYSLGCPFIERCFQLAETNGFVGVIAGNNFTKADFGKPLVEQVLSRLDLSLVVDTSQAFIPHHGTPTILLFARNCSPGASDVRAVLGGRGEEGVPADPEHGQVWSAIARHWSNVGFSNEFAAVVDVPRTVLAKHPWNLRGAAAIELQHLIESRCARRLKDVCVDIGSAVLTRADDVYLAPPGALASRFAAAELRPFVTGKQVRDWSCESDMDVLFPYDESFKQISSERMERWLWPFRTLLWLRREPNGNHREIGLGWWEWSRFIRRRYTDGLQIVYSNLATHNHFALVRKRVVLGSHAPIIALRAAAKIDDYFELLAVLNSSLSCFWMRQVSKDKGGGTDKGGWQSDPAKARFEFGSTRLKQLPIPSLGQRDREELSRLASVLSDLAVERAECLRIAVPTTENMEGMDLHELVRRIGVARETEVRLLNRQIALQEEIDWRMYRLLAIVTDVREMDIDALVECEGAPLGCRPFEIAQRQSGRERGVDGQPLSSDVPSTLNRNLAEVWRSRVAALRGSTTLQVVECESYKRRWLITPKYLAGRVETFDDRLRRRVTELMMRILEAAVAKLQNPVAADRVAARIQDDSRFALLASLFHGRVDYDHTGTVRDLLEQLSVPNHPSHRLTVKGLTKRRTWERVWREQVAEDADSVPRQIVPPETYDKADYVEERVFKLRGSWDVPMEALLAFTEVPPRPAAESLYGWAGWTPLQRVKAILAIDEDLEDTSIPLEDRIGLLDSAWRLLPDVACEDPAAAARLKAELQALVGTEGPSRELIDDWIKRFPPPTKRTTRAKRSAAARAEEDSEREETDES